jgi:multiple sugar transport system permease protein
MTRALAITFGIVALGFFLAPLVWLAVTSLTPDAQLGHPGLPTALTLGHYAAALRGPFARSLANSLFVATLTTLFCLAIGSFAAFALARLEPRFGRVLLLAALAISMFPPIATVSPLYLALRAVHLQDQLVGLVLPDATFALPLTLWLLTAYFRQVPEELYRAARIDGCSPWQAFWRVMLPLGAPGLATTGVLVFISTWNEFLYALTFLSSPEHRTVPVAISLLTTEHRDPWGEIAAASVIATLPLALVTAALQRRIVSGLTAGAVKE